MDKLTDLILPADIGDIQGVLENAPSLVGNAVRDHALQLDGNNQSVNLGNLRNRCLGKRIVKGNLLNCWLTKQRSKHCL